LRFGENNNKLEVFSRTFFRHAASQKCALEQPEHSLRGLPGLSFSPQAMQWRAPFLSFLSRFTISS
jgi:hypothetical protein